MSVVVSVLVNGVPVPLELGDEQLAAIAAELPAPAQEAWPEWMSLATAARYLDVSPERLAKAKQRGKVPCYQEGRGCRILFRRAELDEWMGAHRVEART